jgi:hypothetical protein
MLCGIWDYLTFLELSRFMSHNFNTDQGLLGLSGCAYNTHDLKEVSYIYLWRYNNDMVIHLHLLLMKTFNL